MRGRGLGISRGQGFEAQGQGLVQGQTPEQTVLFLDPGELSSAEEPFPPRERKGGTVAERGERGARTEWGAEGEHNQMMRLYPGQGEWSERQEPLRKNKPWLSLKGKSSWFKLIL